VRLTVSAISRVIERLARDLRSAFPGMQGLSPRNLGYMKAFAEPWPDERILQPLVARLPWGHNVRLLEQVKDSAVARHLNTGQPLLYFQTFSCF